MSSTEIFNFWMIDFFYNFRSLKKYMFLRLTRIFYFASIFQLIVFFLNLSSYIFFFDNCTLFFIEYKKVCSLLLKQHLDQIRIKRSLVSVNMWIVAYIYDYKNRCQRTQASDDPLTVTSDVIAVRRLKDAH